jgi:hypothetical protein
MSNNKKNRTPAAARNHQVGARTAQRQAAQKRTRMLLVSVMGVLIVVAVVVALLAGGGSKSSSTSSPASLFDAGAVSNAIASLPAATFDTVGAGTTTGGPRAVSLTAIAQEGKPELLYVGAEYCPFCAAERWAMVAALSRFGSFANLTATHSATADVFADTPTFSFYGATFTSQYLAFTAVETATNELSGGSYKPLQQLTKEQNAILNETGETGIPLLDFGGKYLISGATYDPGVLAERNGAGIATLIADPTSPISQSVLGAANGITAAICGMTDNQPATVCNSPGVQAARTALGL